MPGRTESVTVESMKPSPAAAVAALAVAIALSVTGLVTAVTAQSTAWRVVGALAVAAAPFFVLGLLGSRRPAAAQIGVILIPALLLVLGLPAVAAVSAVREHAAASSPSGGSADAENEVTSGLPSDPDARLDQALDRADELLPNGSARLLSIDLDDRSTHVVVYDADTGDAVSTHGSDGRWYSTDRRRANDRRTFSRDDLKNLDLNTATGEVRRVAAELKLNADDVHPADGIELKRRTDRMLVAEFTVAFRPIEVDMDGRAADTAGAAYVDRVLTIADKTLRDHRIDPASPSIRQLDFRTITEGSSPITASSIQNSGGFALSLVRGPYSAIKVVPGTFPLATPRTYADNSEGFALRDFTTSALLRARDDLLARNDLPAFDGDVVSFAIGSAPGGRDEGAVLRLQVGSGRESGEAVYRRDGAFLRDGTW